MRKHFEIARAVKCLLSIASLLLGLFHHIGGCVKKCVYFHGEECFGNFRVFMHLKACIFHCLTSVFHY